MSTDHYRKTDVWLEVYDGIAISNSTLSFAGLRVVDVGAKNEAKAIFAEFLLKS